MKIQYNKRIFRFVRSLSNPKKKDDRVAIKFAKKTISVPRDCSRAFCRQFIEHPEIEETKRSVVRKLHNLPVMDSPQLFTPREVAKAINAAKSSKAIGPGGRSMLMLKNLGERGVEYLTMVFNLSLQSLEISDAWKMSRVIPILKSG